MRKLQYKSKKWDKKKEELLESNELDIRLKEVFKLDESKEYEKNKIKYHLLKSIRYISISECLYILENNEKCMEYMNLSIDEIVCAYKLYVGGNFVDDVTRENIKKSMQSGGEAYYAVALGREEEIKNLIDENHILSLLLREEYDSLRQVCSDKKDPIDNMVLAICNRDCKMLSEAIEERIREIRRMSIDYLIGVDIWTIALLKIAKKYGMLYKSQYIELPEFLL